MKLHADRVIEPLAATTPIPNPQMGARPDYNLDFDEKSSYYCP